MSRPLLSDIPLADPGADWLGLMEAASKVSGVAVGGWANMAIQDARKTPPLRTTDM
jgi:hypothetical protein